jgi:hydrogenase/urease accessory protein HupE
VRITISLWLLACPAYAHAPGFAVLELDERDGSVDAVLRMAPETQVDVALDGCEESARRTVARVNLVEVRFTARCPRGVRRASARGLDDGAQLFIVLRSPMGERRVMADAHHPRVSLSEDGGFVRYLRLGVEHVAAGVDHLLFVLGILLLVRGMRRTTLAISAFTIGHSITLALAALDLVRVPAAPVECAIALSILLLAVELARERPTLTREHPALVAGAFGLLHGLGFASALRGAGLPSDAIASSLLGFNVGVELGQLVFVALVLGAITLSRRIDVVTRHAALVRSITVHAIGGAAAYWTISRVLSLGS